MCVCVRACVCACLHACVRACVRTLLALGRLGLFGGCFTAYVGEDQPHGLLERQLFQNRLVEFLVEAERCNHLVQLVQIDLLLTACWTQRASGWLLTGC